MKYKLSIFILTLFLLLIPVTAYSCYNIQVTDQYVTSTSVCICGQGTYNYQTSTFTNYCPQCQHQGTLYMIQGEGCPEGDWRCSNCGCDYCPQCGKECITGSLLWLTPYTPTPITEVKADTTPTKPKTQLEIYTDILKQHPQIITVT